MPSNFPTATTEASSSRDHAPTTGIALDDLRHFPRRDMFGTVEIVDRQFDFVRATLPYDYRFTSNSQSWDEAVRICVALEGPMSALGVVVIAPSSAEQVDGESSRDESKAEAV